MNIKKSRIIMDESLKTYNGHSRSVHSLLWVENDDRNNQFLSGCLDGCIKLWDLSTTKCLRTFTGHKGWVWNLIWVYNNQTQFLSSSNDCTIKLWDIRVNRCLRTYKGHTESVWNMIWVKVDKDILSKNHDTFLSCSGDNTIKQWNLHNSKCIKTIIDTESLSFISWTKNKIKYEKSLNNHQFLSCSGNNIKLWDLDSEKVLKTFIGHCAAVHSVCCIKDKHLFFSCGKDGTIKLWNIYNDQCMKTVRISSGYIFHLYWINKSDMLLGCGVRHYKHGINSGLIELLNITTTNDDTSYDCLQTFVHYGSHTTIYDILYIKNSENKFLSCCEDNTIKLWKHTINNSLLTYIKDWMYLNKITVIN